MDFVLPSYRRLLLLNYLHAQLYEGSTEQMIIVQHYQKSTHMLTYQPEAKQASFVKLPSAALTASH